MAAATPEIGQHTDEILRELGYSRERHPRHARAEGDLTVETKSEARIDARKDGAIGWLVFNNPARRNAVSLDMWEAIPRVLEDFGADPAIRVVVLAGAGDKAFVSGADISQFENAALERRGGAALRGNRRGRAGEAAELRQADHRHDPRLLHRRRASTSPAACDLRIAADDARFAIPAAKLGLGYRASSMKKLVDIVGAAYAKEIMITARQFSAAEAKEMGLVHRVVPVAELEKLDARVLRCHRGERPPHHARRQAHHRRSGEDRLRRRRCATPWSRSASTATITQKGRKAFMEKRKPVFKGS